MAAAIQGLDEMIQLAAAGLWADQEADSKVGPGQCDACEAAGPMAACSDDLTSA